VNATHLRLCRTAVIAFLASRLLLLLMLMLGSQLAFLRKSYGNTVWETEITLSATRFWPELQRMVMTGDSWWYARIAADGYDKSLATPTVAFFPVFPLTVRALGPTGHFALDGIIVSAVSLFVALILLGHVGLRAGFTIDDVERAIFYLCFFPTAYFFSLPLTEALFLLLSVGSVLSGMSGRWWLAGSLGALAALTRVPGTLLLLPLVLIFVERRNPARQAGWLLLVPAGLGLFLWQLHQWTGDALAFVHVQAGWQRHASWPFEPLIRYVSAPSAVSQPWDFTAFHFCVACIVWCRHRNDLSQTAEVARSLYARLRRAAVEQRLASVRRSIHAGHLSLLPLAWVSGATTARRQTHPGNQRHGPWLVRGVAHHAGRLRARMTCEARDKTKPGVIPRVSA
jgi:Gpi18-like mannosyltransferase